MSEQTPRPQADPGPGFVPYEGPATYPRWLSPVAWEDGKPLPLPRVVSEE